MEADVMKFAEATDGKAAGEGKGVVEGMVEGTKDAGEGEGSASSVQRRAWPGGATEWWRAWWRAQRMPARERASLI